MATAESVVCLVVLAAMAACHGPVLVDLDAPLPPPSRAAPNEFRAGAAQVDITPPPGLPSLGYVIAAKHATLRGHQTRLRTQAIVLEDASGSRIALVTMDLAWSSTIVRRKVARRVRESCGISLDRLLIAGTHNHTGPAGFSSWSMYNDQVYRSGGYDANLVEFLVARIARAIESACESLRPATLDIRHAEVADLTCNRSVEAHRANDNLDPERLPINPRLTMLRLAASNGDPIAAFCVFSAHPTTTGPDRKLWHADAFGVAVHEARRRIGGADSGFVVALANGSEGDISFDWKRRGVQSHGMAMMFGRGLADRMVDLWGARGASGSAVTVNSRLERHDLPGASVAPDRSLATQPRMGVSALGGAEDGRTWLYPFFSSEGRKRSKPSGDQGVKRNAFWALQPLIMNTKKAPTSIPVEVIRIGRLRLVALPFEMTVESARRLCDEVSRRLGESGAAVSADDVVVLSAANDYCSYCTTREEYGQQHYEGGFTLYGPHESGFARDRAARVAVAMERGDPVPSLGPLSLSVGPAAPKAISMPPPARPDQPWVHRLLVNPEVHGAWASMYWRGLPRERIRVDAGWLVRIEEFGENGWQPLRIDGELEDDLGLHFEVELMKDGEPRSLWCVRWRPDGRAPVDAIYRFVIAARPGAAQVASAPFRLSEA